MSNRVPGTSARFIVALAAMAFAQAAGAAVTIENIEDRRHNAPADSSLEDIERSIISAASERDWFVTGRTEGRLLLSIVVRQKHEAIVAVEFDKETFSILYVDSVNLDYDPKDKVMVGGAHKKRRVIPGPRIHRNYNRWVAALAERIALRVANPIERRAPQREVPSVPMIADELEKLESLRKRGILTDQEFEAQKNKLLAL